MSALEARHLADLRMPEVTRALRALSTAYVERRHAVGGSLDSAGKRAAFALFYAPLHFLACDQVVRALGAHEPAPRVILDVGCGTGTAGAAWAIAAGRVPAVVGLDKHPWAVEEARWTYRQLQINGRARRADLGRFPASRPGDAIVAAYVLNELTPPLRASVEDQLVAAASSGRRVLILEPIARGIAPWWDAAAARVRATGGRADEWRFQVALPPLVKLLDRAAGLHHEEITVRSLYSSGA